MKSLVRSKLFWIGLMAFLFTYPIIRSINRQLPPPLEVYYSVPSFELVNQWGKAFGSKNLSGRIYLASFAFTSCPSICPKLMKTMQLVQKRIRGLGNKVALVTFTVDPTRDTPPVLNEWAKKLKANPHIWYFLTGEEVLLKNLLTGGFKVSMGDLNPSMMDIAHSGKIILVDEKGQVRGHYQTDPNSINRLMIDMGLLANRSYSLN